MPENLTVGVTGAAGYIGSRVTANLLEDGMTVRPIDNFYEPKVESIEGREIVDIDVRKRQALRKAFNGVDAIMHLAAISGVSDCDERPELAFDTNVVGTENIAWLCREWEIPLLFPASMAIIGDPLEFPISANHVRAPLNLYGRTKQMSEDDIHALAEEAFPSLVLMKSNLYGYHELDGNRVGKSTVINLFVERAVAGETITVHEPGTQARDFVHVDDVARTYELGLEYLMGAPTGATTLPIGSGESLSVLQIAELVQQVVVEELGVEPPIELVENPRQSETDVDKFTVDIEPARETIGFEAEHTVEETIRTMVLS